MLPTYDPQQAPDLTPPDLSAWDNWFMEPPPDDLPPLNYDPFAVQELVPAPADELAELDRLIEEAQSEMNTADGMRRLDDLLEERDWLAEEIQLEAASDTTSDLVDARFLGRADIDVDGAVTGYTVQYMEVYRDIENAMSGRVLDVGRYDTAEQASKVYDVLQESISDGTLTLDDLPVLAQELADTNGLPNDDWRDATPDDHQRFAEKTPGGEPPSRDVPPEAFLSDPAFNSNIFREVTADPEHAAGEQARLANEQALAALLGIGLTVQTDFNLARDSFYDAESGERLVNGVFQQDLQDPTQNCRPMLISLTTTENGLGFAAQAVEFGCVGSLTEVQADHDRVQAALETGGVTAGIEAVETLEVERSIPAVEVEPPHVPSLEIS